MHYYKRNIGDYSKKAGRLSILQHGVYNLLIDACYDRERFPTTEEAIDWVWASTTEEEDAVRFVLKKFFLQDEDGVWVQARIQEEIDDYHKKAKTNKRIANEREAKRKQSSTNRAQSVNEPPPNQEPITNNHKPDKDTLEVNNNHGEEITPAASVCIALKRVYAKHQKSPHDISQTLPKFIACINAGATEQEFVDAANEALRKDKGFAYICATVFNRREEANRLPKIHEGGMPQKPKSSDKSLMARSIFGSDVNDNVGVLEHGDTITAVAERVD